MTILNGELKEVAYKVIRQGLDDAAKSLEFFTKTETNLELDEDFKFNGLSALDLAVADTDQVYVLTTTLEGEMNGVAYLLVTKNEVEALMKAYYPGKEFDEAKYEKKSNNLLLEMDNIITASVVTQLANHFKYKTYGGVPQLQIISKAALEELISSKKGEHDFVIDFKAKFVAQGVDVKADFIWFVDETFVEGVKNII